MANIEGKIPNEEPMKPQKLFLGAQFFLRTLVVATSLAATWKMFTNKQIIDFGGFYLDARYDYSPEFKFFAIANIIACVFSIVTLIFLLLVGHRHAYNPSHYFLLFFNDLVVMALVLAGCAAATAVGMLGKYGNTHTGWMAICDNFAKFCNQATISFALSYISLICLFTLTIMSAIKSRQYHVSLGLINEVVGI